MTTQYISAKTYDAEKLLKQRHARLEARRVRERTLRIIIGTTAVLVLMIIMSCIAFAETPIKEHNANTTATPVAYTTAAHTAVEQPVKHRNKPVQTTQPEQPSEEQPVQKPEQPPVQQPVQEAEPVDVTPQYHISDFFSDSDIIKIAKTAYGEAGITRSETEIAAVIWCILNRYDIKHNGADCIDEIIVWSQFNGYHEETVAPDYIMDLTMDVLGRYIDEKNGIEDAGRVLPKEYIYFMGDGRHNHFMIEWPDGAEYNWSMKSPYDT